MENSSVSVLKRHCSDQDNIISSVERDRCYTLTIPEQLQEVFVDASPLQNQINENEEIYGSSYFASVLFCDESTCNDVAVDDLCDANSPEASTEAATDATGLE